MCHGLIDIHVQISSGQSFIFAGMINPLFLVVQANH